MFKAMDQPADLTNSIKYELVKIQIAKKRLL